MSATSNLKTIFNLLNIVLPDNIKQDIEFNLKHNDYINKHISFIFDLKTRKIICYEFNVFFKSDSFPFSVHAEIQSIVKYYKSKSISKHKKGLLVVKLSRTGIIGNSKCCLNCMRFLRNNLSNLNLKEIYYSIVDNRLGKLRKKDLIDDHFKLSKGFSYCST